MIRVCDWKGNWEWNLKKTYVDCYCEKPYSKFCNCNLRVYVIGTSVNPVETHARSWFQYSSRLQHVLWPHWADTESSRLQHVLEAESLSSTNGIKIQSSLSFISSPRLLTQGIRRRGYLVALQVFFFPFLNALMYV